MYCIHICLTFLSSMWINFLPKISRLEFLIGICVGFLNPFIEIQFIVWLCLAIQVLFLISSSWKQILPVQTEQKFASNQRLHAL